ncbi:MAG: IS200/IS605 family element transposase accessory protein TnpB [Herpetosiphonaceae bacterium]|nr:IS200/IS605 family element transposase accessory protein TnpB [Herpetosiphonaceae bacterium]
MLKTFVYRVYPSKTQIKRLERVLETCRHWYNDCLSERQVAYAERGEQIGKFEQLAKVKERRHVNPWAAEVHSHVLQVVVTDVDKAFQAFFRRVRGGETPGYPRYKSQSRFHSFGYKEYGNGFKVDGRRLRLSGIGRVALRWHRPIQGTIKTVRLVRKVGWWYACFACEVEQQPLPATGQEIAIDAGLTALIVTSQGEKIENPHWFRKAEHKLRVFQRRVARRKLDGSNRQKARLQLQRYYKRISNRRKDFHNKLVYSLIQQYDRIACENLHITYMVHNRKLAKSILDASWGYLIRHLQSKAVEAGRAVCLVDPSYTSRICSQCGHLFEALSLNDRWISCRCGLSLDRDHNAAINILNRAGQVRWALNSP